MPAVAVRHVAEHQVDLRGMQPLEDILHRGVGRRALPVQAESLVALATMNVDERDEPAV